MAGSDKTVKVTLVAVATPYQKGMAEAGSATKKLGSDIEGTSKKQGAFASSAGKATAALKAMAVAGAAVAGTALVAFLGDAVKAAGDLEQSVGGVDAVFKDSANLVHEFGKTSAESVGLSTNAFNELVTVTGAMLKNKGLEDFTAKSIDLVKVGADLSATFGGTAAQAVEALNAAMRGESDPIERYGISLNEAAVKAELAAKGADKLTGAALEQAKAQARIDIIMRQSADAMGAFGREADTLQGQQQRLSAEWENAKATLGQALLPAVTSIVEAMRVGVEVVVAAVEAWGQIPGPVKAAVAALVAFRVAQSTLSKGGTAVITTLSSLREAISYAAQSAQRAGGGMAGLGAGLRTFTGSAGLASSAMGGMRSAGSALMGLAGGPWGLAMTGLTIAITGYFQAQENARRAAEEFAATLDKTTGKFTEQSRELAAQKFFKDFAETDYSKVAGSLEKAGVGLADLIAAYEQGGPAVDEFKAKFDAWQSSTEAIDLQNVGVNIMALGNSYAALGRDMDGANDAAAVQRDVAGQVAEKTKAMGGAADTAAGQTSDLADATAELKKQADAAKQQLDNLRNAVDMLSGGELALRAASRDMQAAIEDAGKAAKAKADKTKSAAEVERDFQAALDRVATSTQGVIKEMMSNGASADSLKKKYNEGRDAIEKQLRARGLEGEALRRTTDKIYGTRDAFNDLLAEYKKTPKEVETTVKAHTDAAKSKISDILSALSGIKSKTVTVTTVYQQRGQIEAQKAGVAARRPDVYFGKAAGGAIYGPGTGTSDTAGIYALSNGEHVLTASDVKGLGGQAAVYALRAAVQRGWVPGLADGGAVRAVASTGLVVRGAPTVSMAAPAAPSLSGIAISGTLDTPWGPSQIRGVVVDELASAARVARRDERAGVR